jgi:hypothetical protein
VSLVAALATGLENREERLEDRGRARRRSNDKAIRPVLAFCFGENILPNNKVSAQSGTSNRATANNALLRLWALTLSLDDVTKKAQAMVFETIACALLIT